jgi:hypothetical protein
MNIGYNKPLFIQPFEHRGSFQTKLLHKQINLKSTDL